MALERFYECLNRRDRSLRAPTPPFYPDLPEEESEDVESLDGQPPPRFLLVELDCLNTLLQRCHKCGQLPSGKNAGKPRLITWSQSGTCLTDYRCSCSGKDRIRWSAQSQIGEGHTGMKVGNLAVAVVAQVN